MTISNWQGATVDHALQTMRGLLVHRSAGQEQPVKSSRAAVVVAPAVTGTLVV